MSSKAARKWRAFAVKASVCAALAQSGFLPAQAGIQLTTKSPAEEVNWLGESVFSHKLVQGAGGNVVISPLSLTVALQMAAAGAGGKTEQAFQDVLRLALPIDTASTILGGLVHRISKPDKNLIMRTANGIWLAEDAKAQATYLASQRKNFNARVETKDFADPKTIEAINQWFARETQNLIPKMLSELPAETRVVLANALYFKGRWAVPFPAAQTKPGAFKVAGGQAIDVPMMRQPEKEFLYRQGDDYQAVRLPFAGGGYEMVIALPREGLAAVEWAKTLREWDNLLDPKKYSQQPGTLALPRLKVASGGEIRPPLEAIGLKDAFGNDADFSRMARSPVHFDQVVHRTVLTWDEEGAEAAAGTAIVATRTAAFPQEPFEMIVDRPFILALRHVQTGALVLLGLVNDPREAS